MLIIGADNKFIKLIAIGSSSKGPACLKRRYSRHFKEKHVVIGNQIARATFFT